MQWTQKDGGMSSEAILYFDELSQTLVRTITLLNETINSQVITDGSQANGTIVNNGVIMPNMTTALITGLEPNSSLGTVWFNTDLAKLQVKTAPGVIQTVTST